MSDYIKRESRTLIEIADDLNDLVTELNDKIVETIREKNAVVAPKWIPCEERLPEKEEKAYLVYLDNGHVCECRWWCLDPVFLKPTDNWRWHLMDKPQYTKVLAWMPLPEPYGERKDDE